MFSLSKGEEDEDGVGVIKIYSLGKNDDFFFFFLGKHRLWMRITLARSWCGLLDNSLHNSCKSPLPFQAY